MRPGMWGAPMMMRMIFSLMHADGDWKLSLQEFQAAHEHLQGDFGVAFLIRFDAFA